MTELELGTLVVLGGGLGEMWVVQDRRMSRHGWWYTFRCVGESGTREGYFEEGGGSGRVVAEPGSD